MKTNGVATQNARKFMALFQISVLLLVISCSKSDDLEIIKNVTPVVDQVPDDNQNPDNMPTSDSNELDIIYTDIDPDFNSENVGDVYNLDLNHDGIVDYTLSLWSDSWSNNLLISSPNGINASITVTPWYANTVPLENEVEIFNLDGARNGEIYEYWGVFTIGNCFGGEAGCFYDWKDKKDKYLGLRFLINGQIHYGWVRMDVTSTTQWVIKDYAYNAIPNQAIFAGQKV